MYKTDLETAGALLRDKQKIVAFTGAGISVESGLPPFRGENGLYNTVDPLFLEIGYFHRHPKESWERCRALFFNVMQDIEPNPAHHALADLEKAGRLSAVITQNIDGLHQKAGSKIVHEYHGSLRRLACMECETRCNREEVDLETLPPVCPDCGGILKPDFVFFGEPIPEETDRASRVAAATADAIIIVGADGAVMPAAAIPVRAKFPNQGIGCPIVEINIKETTYSTNISDVLLPGKAGEMLPLLTEVLLS